MRDNPPFFNPLVTQQLLQNPFAAVTGALALGFDVALLLTLVGVRLAPTEHPNVGRSVGFGVVLALLAFAFVASLVFRIVSRYAAVSERIQEIAILRVLGASLPWLMNLLAQETLVLAVGGFFFGIMMMFAADLAITYSVPHLLVFRVMYEWWPVAVVIAGLTDLAGAFLSLFRILSKDPIDALFAEE
jgi:ABC-type antimicrobial peptide transport system permease subunit